MKKILSVFVLLILILVVSCEDPNLNQFFLSNQLEVYLIQFEPNGASGNTKTQEVLSYDFSTASLEKNPFFNDGYVFSGWNTQADGTGKAYAQESSVMNVFSASEARCITLYAQWTPVYTVIFDANNGTGEVAEQSFISGESHALINVVAGVKLPKNAGEKFPLLGI